MSIGPDLHHIKERLFGTASSQDLASNPVHEQVSLIQRAFTSSQEDAQRIDDPGDSSPSYTSAAEACLEPILLAMGWYGQERHIAEAMPHFDRIRDVDGLRAVLARLHIETRPAGKMLHSIDAELCPALVEMADGRVLVVLSRESDGLLVFDGTSREIRTFRQLDEPGTLYCLSLFNSEDFKARINRSGWLWECTKTFKFLILNILFISFLVNLAGLTLPLFVMHVYDLGIGAKAPHVVFALAVGAGLVMVTEYVIRGIRGKAMAYFGARFDAVLGMSAFQHLLHLPLSMTENAPIGTQISRLRMFESVRESFTGTLAAALVDIPFILIFLVTISLIAGHLVWIPISLVGVYAVLATVALPLSRSYGMEAGEARQRKQNLMLEMISRRQTINTLAAEDVFLERFEKFSTDCHLKQLRSSHFNSFVQIFSQSMMTLAGGTTLWLGALWVMSGQLSHGALIAVMALIWRILSPLQQTFVSLPRLEQTLQTFQQVDRLMRLKLEREPGQLAPFYRTFKGAIKVNKLVFRYANRPELSLRGAHFEVAAGETVCITGPSGCGKSTLLKCMLGLYPPQGGAIIADGLDLRQIDPAEWRASISYAPDVSRFFYGTIGQNLRLAHPTASAADLHQALHEAGVLSFLHSLPDGLETRLNSLILNQMPPALKQRLVLARAYVKTSPIYLLDNPANHLDGAGEELLLQKLKALKGRSTVIFTSQRPSHMRLADRLLYMEEGQIIMDGAPHLVLAKISSAA